MIGQKTAPSILIDGVLNDSATFASISINGEETIFNLTVTLIPNDFKEKVLNNDFIGKEAKLIEEVRDSATANNFVKEISIKIKKIFLEYILSDEDEEPTLYNIIIYGTK